MGTAPPQLAWAISAQTGAIRGRRETRGLSGGDSRRRAAGFRERLTSTVMPGPDAVRPGIRGAAPDRLF